MYIGAQLVKCGLRIADCGLNLLMFNSAIRIPHFHKAIYGR
jgi:hypothetical protein